VKNSIEMTRLINEALAESAPPPAEPSDRRDAGPADDLPASASPDGSAEGDAEDTPGERPAYAGWCMLPAGFCMVLPAGLRRPFAIPFKE
jgi:hypothetical protein